jgi:4-amino-4-deoxy-L-arabinose transferase-like glycosyltransferase
LGTHLEMRTRWFQIEAPGRRDGAAWLLALVFAIYAGSLLTSLDYNFDEGVYIQQARLMLDGQRPYVDFFYHQTPLYPFTLMAAGWFARDALFSYRLLSLIATVLCGILVYRIARRLMPWGAALIAALIFYCAPLQYFGLVALPNSLMSFLATAGVYLVWFHPDEQDEQAPAVSALAGLLLGASILYKPLSLPIALAVGTAVLLSRQARPRAIWLVVGAAAIGFGTWAFFHWTSDGQFTRLLELQASRYSAQSGFDVMSGFEPFRQAIAERGIDSPLGWNLAEHKLAFLTLAPHANLHIAMLALAGQFLLWSRWGGVRASQHRVLLTLWWGLPFVFCLVVWEPSWDHYFVQYLPPLSILGALFLWRLWSAQKARLISRAVVILLIVYVTVAGAGTLWARRLDYDSLAKPVAANESWLLFDPFLNFVTGTRPACGLIDPFNVFGRRSLIGSSTQSGLTSNFGISTTDLILCLQKERGIKIGTGGLWSTWFTDGTLAETLNRLPEDRFVDLWQRPN